MLKDWLDILGHVFINFFAKKLPKNTIVVSVH